MRRQIETCVAPCGWLGATHIPINVTVTKGLSDVQLRATYSLHFHEPYMARQPTRFFREAREGRARPRHELEKVIIAFQHIKTDAPLELSQVYRAEVQWSSIRFVQVI
jgi:hypothetical protein